MWPTQCTRDNWEESVSVVGAELDLRDDTKGWLSMGKAGGRHGIVSGPGWRMLLAGAGAWIILCQQKLVCLFRAEQ